MYLKKLRPFLEMNVPSHTPDALKKTIINTEYLA